MSQPVVADSRNIGLLMSAESVKEHISRLISENEAILEQNPGLIKRRPYHRQVGSQSSIELETGIRSQSNSPGISSVTFVFILKRKWCDLSTYAHVIKHAFSLTVT